MRREKSIAVLPFVCLSPNKEDEFFCDGITEEIINALSKIQDVYVTSRTSSFFFKNQEFEVKEIAQKLGVRFIVEGSTRRAGKNVRVTVQLINAEDDYHYWSENFDYELIDVFQIQDDIAIAVQEKFRELSGHFTIEESSQPLVHGSQEAHELILRAKHHATDLSGGGVQLGLELIEKAVKMEPENPVFLASKATYISALGIMGAWPVRVASQLAIKACNDALRIDPENPEAHAIKGHLSFALTGELDLFYFHIKKTLAVRPRDIYALYFISIIESAQGHYEESMAAIEAASEVDPLSLLPNYFRTINLMRLRRFDEAHEAVDSFLLNYPAHLNAYNVKGLLLLRTGKPKIALAHFCKMPGPNGEQIPFYGGMAMACAILGNITDADKYLELSLKHDDELHLSYCENPAVFVNFMLGRFEEGYKELEEDVKLGKWYVRFYKTIPFFDSIMKDPRSKILKRAFIERSETTEDSKKKYAKSGLSDNEVKSIEAALNAYIASEKPFLDPDLSLKKLAQQIDINPNQLSQVINTQTNKNFFDYINSHRIKELMQILKDQKSKKFTLLSLAYEAGFNSKSTFNSSFKKLTGLTPSEYMKSIETKI